MYEGICYKKNFISEVICRLDFANPIDAFNNSMPKDLNNIIRKYYPIAETQGIIGTQLQINSETGPVINNILNKQWVFWSIDRKKICRIDSTCIVFSLNTYDVFDDFRNIVLEITKAILSLGEEYQGKRFGLRYINKIPIGGHDNWISKNYLDPLLVHKDDKTVRLMNIYEYSVIEKGLQVKLQYGYLNSDYPAIMKNEDFTIDVDAFSQSIIFNEDIEYMLDNMHYEIQDCFEKLISEELKEEMNSEEE